MEEPSTVPADREPLAYDPPAIESREPIREPVIASNPSCLAIG